MSTPHLPSAPIREAVLEIRCEGVTFSDEAREGFCARLAAEYPGRRERLKFDVDLATNVARRSVDGMLLDSEDGTSVVQARADGFAFSRLRPYKDWGDLQASAQRHWELYVQLFRPERAVRLGLRFINDLALMPGERLEDLVTVLPSLPSSLASSVQRPFSVQVSPAFPELDAAATVWSQYVPAEGEIAGCLTLDVDVFRDVAMGPEDPGIWEGLQHLRELKNFVFFSSVTASAVKRYA